jgi:hypothetical protein
MTGGMGGRYVEERRGEKRRGGEEEREGERRGEEEKRGETRRGEKNPSFCVLCVVAVLLRVVVLVCSARY